MKSKNWNKLKAYLMSQKIVDKDFNDITKYKMDRDILSVLQRSFSTYHEQVENESFSSLVEEQRYIEEYIELLEFALESIAEQLELNPNELVEAYRLTPARSAVLDRERNKSRQTMSKIGMSAVEKGRMTDKAKSKFNHAAVRDTRIAAIRRGAGVGVKSIAKGDSENVRAETPSERHEIGREERRRRTEKKSTKLGDGLRVWSKRLRD